MLRGAIYEDGNIESFYVKNDQRNLIAFFFQLPDKAVRVGDTWTIDIHYFSIDQHFTCDTSCKQNRVTLIDVKSVGSEKIAVLEYDLAEYILGDITYPMSETLIGNEAVMNMKYRAIAEFLIKVVGLHTMGLCQ